MIYLTVAKKFRADFLFFEKGGIMKWILEKLFLF